MYASVPVLLCRVYFVPGLSGGSAQLEQGAPRHTGLLESGMSGDASIASRLVVLSSVPSESPPGSPSAKVMELFRLTCGGKVGMTASSTSFTLTGVPQSVLP